MHVLYIHQYFTPPEGSGGSRSYQMAKRLVNAGHEVTMLTTVSSATKWGGPVPDASVVRAEYNGIRVIALRIPYHNRMSHSQRLRAFLAFVFGAIREGRRLHGVDVVFATSTPLTVALPGVAAKRKHRCPMVFEVRDLWPELPIAVGALRGPIAKALARRLERWAYRNSSHIVALSPGMKEGVCRTGYPESSVTVIPNCSDVEEFRVPPSAGEAFLAEHPYLRGGPLVTYAGALGPVNGVAYLADIAVQMRAHDPSTRFLIIGDGKEREAIRAHAESLGVLGSNLWLLDPLPKRAMPSVLAASAVSCSLLLDMPALTVSSPNKVFDAFAAGKPVMITYEGWLADLLREADAGIVVPRGAARGAASALHEFLSSPDKLRRAGQASARLADERFARDLLAADLRRVLEGVVTGG